MTKERLKKYRALKSELDYTKSKKLNNSELETEVKEIENFVERVRDYNLKRAITIYYMSEIEDGNKKTTWEDVACVIGNGFTENSIKKAVSRYLKKN